MCSFWNSTTYTIKGLLPRSHRYTLAWYCSPLRALSNLASCTIQQHPMTTLSSQLHVQMIRSAVWCSWFRRLLVKLCNPVMNPLPIAFCQKCPHVKATLPSGPSAQCSGSIFGLPPMKVNMLREIVKRPLCWCKLCCIQMFHSLMLIGCTADRQLHQHLGEGPSRSTEFFPQQIIYWNHKQHCQTLAIYEC